MAGTLTLKNQTFFKQDFAKSGGDDTYKAKFFAAANQTFNYVRIETDVKTFQDHLKVNFAQPLKGVDGSERQTWYVYAPHIKELKA